MIFFFFLVCVCHTLQELINKTNLIYDLFCLDKFMNTNAVYVFN